MSVEGNEGFLEIPNASLRVSGNVHAEGIKLGVVELIPSYDLASVSNVGNTTIQYGAVHQPHDLPSGLLQYRDAQHRQHSPKR
jgi:hypothetical protein